MPSKQNNQERNSAQDSDGVSTWWAPGALIWWIAVLFSIGSTCFTVGSAPYYAKAVGNVIAGVTFFAGSIFFTSAAFLQYLRTANQQTAQSAEILKKRHFRILTFEPARIDWWAAVVQFAGTLAFNISTFGAMYTSLMNSHEVDHNVWRPDIYGCICFIIASLLALIAVGRVKRPERHSGLSMWIASINMVGSVAFACSGVASYVVPTTGKYINMTLVNLGTFIGGICFFVGAILLLPESKETELT